MFSFKSFIVLGHTFRSLMHSELFLCAMLSLLHVDIQFSQHQLLKRLSFPPLGDLGTLIKNQMTIYAKVYF